jgi:leucyl-tRNA synthetase
MSEFGFPPQFPAETTDPGIEEEVVDPADPTRRVKKVKSKVVAKGGGAKYQWPIMKGIGLEDEEIKKFADPHHWLSYFPPCSKSDLQALGCRVSTAHCMYIHVYRN